MTDTRRCGDCSHGEAHGFNREAQRNGWAVTVSFWCPLKRHHDVAGEACELYAAGENRRVYDDAGRAANGIASDLATYSNTGQAVDKWTAESVRELVMDCSRRGHADGDGCWHIEGEPQHWQRLADELNRVTAEATAEEGSSRVPVGSSTWTVKKVCELLERNTYADGRTTEYDSLGNGYEVNVYSTDYQAIADELNEACTKSYIVADATGQNPSSHEDESDNHVSFGGRKVTFDAEDVLKLLHRNQDCTDATAYYFNQHGLQAIAEEINERTANVRRDGEWDANGTADGTPMGHVPTDDGTVPIDALNAGRGTCSNTVEKIPGEMPRLHCSNCNAITTLDIPDQMAESYMAWPRFCASCGARAMEVD